MELEAKKFNSLPSLGLKFEEQIDSIYTPLSQRFRLKVVMFTFVLAIHFVESCFDHNSVLIMNGYDQAIEIKNNLASFFFPPSTWKGKKCKYNLLQPFRDYHVYSVYYCLSFGKDITLISLVTDCNGMLALKTIKGG